MVLQSFCLSLPIACSPSLNEILKMTQKNSRDLFKSRLFIAGKILRLFFLQIITVFFPISDFLLDIFFGPPGFFLDLTYVFFQFTFCKNFVIVKPFAVFLFYSTFNLVPFSFQF